MAGAGLDCPPIGNRTEQTKKRGWLPEDLSPYAASSTVGRLTTEHLYADSYIESESKWNDLAFKRDEGEDMISRQRRGRIYFRLDLAGILIAFATFIATSSHALAQEWPSRTITFILPFGPGSATDAAARVIGERLQKVWRRPVVIENRPGGDGLIAIRGFLTANDDHTLLYASSGSFLAHPYTLQETTPYNLERDFMPIVQVAHTVPAIAAPVSLEVTNLKAWIDAIRNSKAEFSGAGAAGVPELGLMALIKTEAPRVVRVPYRDIVPAANDLAENRIQLLFTSLAVVRPLIEAGRIRLVAVPLTERSPLVPDVPTAVEVGFPDLIIETTSGLYGPATMRREIRDRIAADSLAVLGDAEVERVLAATGQAIAPGGPDVLASTLRSQQKRVSTLASQAGQSPK